MPSYNGNVSIGKDLKGCRSVIFDENKKPVKDGEQGELCLSGKQLFNGYLNNPQKDAEVFFDYEGTRFYRSGDICFRDENGDIMYCSRLDGYVKIQGWRVELGEIEYHTSKFLDGINSVAFAINDNTQIAICIETDNLDESLLFAYLKEKMPAYMIPVKIIKLPSFPLNSNGKIDKKKIRSNNYE